MGMLHQAEVTALIDRSIHTKLSIPDLRFPKEVGYAGRATDPVQLFAAAWSSCFITSLIAAAGIERIKIGEVSVTTKISVSLDDNDLELYANLIVKLNGIDYDTADKLIKVTKSICNYSKAAIGNINTVYEIIEN
ncbi:MAG: OsmC family protein [Leptospiraceae bacterium]|nr:OsmC family protein [Leptospiraceae bacterium]